MKCLYCDSTFSLTWKIYWKAPTGKVTCPKCAKKQKAICGVKYWLLLILTVTVCFICSTFIPSYFFVLFLTIIIVVDKWLSENAIDGFKKIDTEQ